MNSRPKAALTGVQRARVRQRHRQGMHHSA